MTKNDISQSKVLKKADLSFKQKCELIDKTQFSKEFSWAQIEKLVNYMGVLCYKKKRFYIC